MEPSQKLKNSNEMMLAHEVKEVNSISFNQDQNIMHICTKTGFKIYSLDPISLLIEKEIDAGTLIVQSLLNVGFVFIVTSNNNETYNSKTLLIWDKQKQQVISSYKYNEYIYEVLISNNLLIIAFPSQVECRTIANQLICSTSTFYNLSGICSVSYSVNFCLVSPHVDEGFVNIQWFKPQKDVIVSERMPVSCNTDKYICESSVAIKCNQSGVQKLQLNFMGNILAVASVTGTIIRLFDTKTCEKLREFRRGTTPALISFMQFTTDNTLFTCCSEKDTIHVFKVNDANTTSYFGMLSYFVPITGDQWSFAQIGTQKLENINTHYKIVIRTGFAFLINNYQEYAVTQIPNQGLVQINQFQQLI